MKVGEKVSGSRSGWRKAFRIYFLAVTPLERLLYIQGQAASLRNQSI
jgi:hypothetical protein